MKCFYSYLIFLDWSISHSGDSFDSSSFSCLNKIFDASLRTINIAFTILLSTWKTIHTFGLNGDIFLKFLNFIYEASNIMETICYIMEVRTQSIIVITQLDQNFLLLVKQSLYLIRLSLPVQLLHNMKCLVLLSNLNQLCIPELGHLIDSLRYMCRLLLHKHRYPVPFRSALKHYVHLLPVTLTRQRFLELIVVYFKCQFLFKSCDQLVNVQNLAWYLSKALSCICDLVGLLLHLLRVLLNLFIGLVDLYDLFLNGNNLLFLDVKFGLRGYFEFDEFCTQTIECCNVCFELDERFEDVVILILFTVVLIYQILQLPILCLLLLHHILQSLQPWIFKLLQYRLQSLFSRLYRISNILLVDPLLEQLFAVFDLPDSLGLRIIDLQLEVGELLLDGLLVLVEVCYDLSKALGSFLKDAVLELVLFDFVVREFNQWVGLFFGAVAACLDEWLGFFESADSSGHVFELHGDDIWKVLRRISHLFTCSQNFFLIVSLANWLCNLFERRCNTVFICFLFDAFLQVVNDDWMLLDCLGQIFKPFSKIKSLT